MNEIQRSSLFGEMLEELVQRGYGEISVDRVCEAVGVPETEFAAEFADKDGCLFAAYDRLCDGLVRTAGSGCQSDEPWPERVRRGLDALLEDLAAQPTMAQALTRSFPGIRPATYERYVALLTRFEPFMHEGREYSGLGDELPGEVELLAVGAAEAIIFGEVDAGRAQSLPAIMPEILFSVLVPFLGPDRAAEEMRTAATAT